MQLLAGALACVPRGIAAVRIPTLFLLATLTSSSPAACSRNWLAAAELFASPPPRERQAQLWPAERREKRPPVPRWLRRRLKRKGRR